MLRILLSVILIWLFGGCAKRADIEPKPNKIVAVEPVEIKSFAATKSVIDINITNDSYCNDIEIDKEYQSSGSKLTIDKYPQNIEYYLNGFTREDNNITQLQETFATRYYSPWSFSVAPKDKSTLLWPLKVHKSGFGQNLRPVDKHMIENLHQNTNIDEYATVNRRAYVIKYSDIRTLPTHKPLFKDPRLAGEGYPFDQLQNSSVNYGEAIFVSHYSVDRAWCFVYTNSVSGWIKRENIAFIDDKKISDLKNSKKLFIKKDNLPMYRLDGEFVDFTRAGMMLSYLQEDEKSYYAKSVDKNGDFIRILIPKDSANIGFSDLNMMDLSTVLSELLRNSYGWGGYLGERDCSSMIRDYAAVFGIMMPRNSAAQAKRGEIISLQDMSNDEKKETIIKQAIAFETIAYLKGHVLLYVGRYENEPLFMHNIWGIRTKDKNGKNGRFVIGRTIISSLDIGSELSDFDPEGSLLNRLESINIFTRVTELAKK